MAKGVNESRNVTALGLIAALLIAVSAEQAAAAPPWKLGLATVEITPQHPVRMSGYDSRTQLSQGVASPLFAKAMLLEDMAGNRALLITSDVIGFTAAYAEPTCRLIQEKTGLLREQILLNSSHTHTGPVVSLHPEESGMEEDHAEATRRYSKWLQNRLVEVAAASLEKLEPVELAWGVGVAPFVMNRREFTQRGVILGVNPRGLADRSVPVLRATNAAGRITAVLFGVACHNTTLTGKHLEISGDFAGYSQQLIQETLPGVQAMFMQGCCGDANPYPRGSEAISQQHGETLGSEVLRVLETKLKPLAGSLRTVFANVELPLQDPPDEAETERLLTQGGGWRRFIAAETSKLREAKQQLPNRYVAPFALWQIGDGLTLVAFPGEVVVDYVALVEQALGPRRLWVAAFSNDVFGYLPSARVLEEGGYETRGLYSGGVGMFRPDAQDAAIEAIVQMAKKAGRPSLD